MYLLAEPKLTEEPVMSDCNPTMAIHCAINHKRRFAAFSSQFATFFLMFDDFSVLFFIFYVFILVLITLITLLEIVIR
jgi:uncharacterized membrane protein (DUF485 family)